MNIYASEGDKVIVTEISYKNGDAYDKRQAAEYLEVNKVYTVDYTEVSNWHTDVHLKEIPGQRFNSVLFENYMEEDEEEEDEEVNLTTDGLPKVSGWFWVLMKGYPKPIPCWFEADQEDYYFLPGGMGDSSSAGLYLEDLEKIGPQITEPIF